MARGGSKTFTMMTGCMCCVSLFISCFLLGFSFDTLDPNQMGFIYDANTMTLETDVLYNKDLDDKNGGRIFTGLGRHFGDYRFPRFTQRILFSNEEDADSRVITAKTQDGLNVDVAVSVQYHLKRTAFDISQVVAKFGILGAWQGMYMRVARRIVRDVLSQFRMNDLWQRRGQVTIALETAIRNALDPLHATVTGLQLLNLDIAATVRDAIQTTTVEEQGIELTRQTQQVTLVEVITEQQRARQDALVTVINAGATSQATVIAARAAAEALNTTVTGQRGVIEATRDIIGFTSTDRLLDYLQIQAIAKSRASAKLAVPQPGGAQ